MAVVIGEKDNKDVLEKRKRSERKERLQMNRSVGAFTQVDKYTVKILKSKRAIYEIFRAILTCMDRSMF
jgi:hypothetical protein